MYTIVKYSSTNYSIFNQRFRKYQFEYQYFIFEFPTTLSVYIKLWNKARPILFL